MTTPKKSLRSGLLAIEYYQNNAPYLHMYFSILLLFSLVEPFSRYIIYVSRPKHVGRVIQYETICGGRARSCPCSSNESNFSPLIMRFRHALSNNSRLNDWPLHHVSINCLDKTRSNVIRPMLNGHWFWLIDHLCGLKRVAVANSCVSVSFFYYAPIYFRCSRYANWLFCPDLCLQAWLKPIYGLASPRHIGQVTWMEKESFPMNYYALIRHLFILPDVHISFVFILAAVHFRY